ncbi:MAG: glutamine--fructose-6-phosphate transaminase (isomerizing) [Candidatus Brocadiaceae bacterium]|jgi:glucosamine--fructose-6-phosphate aminotransferase (isomerizing)
MCGIFGYVGPRAEPALLIESLKRLEYRGYDSWGIGIGHDGEVSIHRETGRISAARVPALGGEAGGCWGGISHTRWATHGAPNERNAHPHLDCTGKLAIVHNGIIENHSALRAELEAAGHTFRSETDTEVIAHLIEELLADEGDVQSAFLGALKLLEGTYGVAAIWADRPGLLLAARHGSPLVLGLGEGEMMVASDPAALVAHTRRVVYLSDGEAAALRADGFETHDLDAVPVSKKVEQLEFDLPAIERGGYAHFMLKEIFEQPETIRNAFRGRIAREEGTAKLGGVDSQLLRRTRRCHILACGTSWHAGLVGKYLLENLAGVPTQVSYAAEFRYANPVIEPDTLFIAISQSGETADTLAGVREAKLRGAEAMGICNVVGSTIARECGQGVYIHAGPEIGVASTKAFTGQLVALALLAVHMGRMRQMPLKLALECLDALEKLPHQAEAALACDEQIKEIAEQYAECPNFLYVGRLYEYPLALEGALKLKEISYVHAEGTPAAELKHGPIALVDEKMPTVVLAAQSSILEKMLANVEEIRARGGRIIAVAREGDDELPRLAEETIFLPPTPDPLVPIVGAIPLQLLAYHIAVLRGCDVDRPRNLAKSVTVE